MLMLVICGSWHDIKRFLHTDNGQPLNRLVVNALEIKKRDEGKSHANVYECSAVQNIFA